MWMLLRRPTLLGRPQRRSVSTLTPPPPLAAAAAAAKGGASTTTAALPQKKSREKDFGIAGLRCSDPAGIEQFFLQRLAHVMGGTAGGPKTAPLWASLTDVDTEAEYNSTGPTREEVRYHRRLSSRFTSLCDQGKSHGTAEVAFHTLHSDVQRRVRWARDALRILQDALSQQPCREGGAVPRRLVVLLLYSHTQHDAAVGLHMKRIRDTVKAMLAEQHEEVLGVLTVVVGAKWRGLAVAGASAGSADEEINDTSFRDDTLWYPYAGLYTFNALLQCLCMVGLEADGSDITQTSIKLHRKIVVVSEGWFHVRTAAEMHQPRSSLSVAHGDTIDVEPMPFVLGSTHSEEELLQFARYTACRALA
ncbi:hypothetical protein DQ04_16161000 [Trypanosoma grayi]|uniref:hypothetical protein n=1 Tax=Trypanosoma grayi TaxID=71804 RepID=UPI0004F3EF45|nr:hypothetical protein DQ04_16161000 [Trypanosoma grayi]KEG06064.1 hypothetical protein DQ04_16161000 [Trypanosoma grayi]